VGIAVDPKKRSFFSFVRSGADIQFYDSAYWRSRGMSRFYRYVTDKPMHAGRTLEAIIPTVKIPRETIIQVAGKNPSGDPYSKSSGSSGNGRHHAPAS
jgi:hypothetical protein